MGKILLFYLYTSVENPEEIRLWQKELCTKLALTGRIILAHEGINGTLGGSRESAEQYKKEMLNHPLFAAIDFKESDGDAHHFPRLRIVIKKEIVNLGLDPITINAQNGGVHLTPQQTHELLNNKPENLVVLDGRNYYEARVGKFTDAITPEIQNFRDFPEYIDNNVEIFKDKTVLMYCTGGIRCERASAYLKSKGVTKEVYQVAGGIHRYVEQFPEGHFRGKNYVFDGRITQKITNDILATCDTCATSCDEYTNCINAACNKQIILCDPCIAATSNTCSEQCDILVKSGQTNIRILPKKYRPHAQPTA